ncbi:MAG TPA: DUF1097 domain-containing protein [Gemmatimonadales bacterium]|jgi:hypothetical protein|nr:DUF1097 domain-containing protein [Gemmatimonadales bacterium]
MNPLMAQAISIGVLLAFWDFISGLVHLSIYPGIIAMGCFYASGGKTEGLVKSLAGLLSGAFWALVATQLGVILGEVRVLNALVVGLAGVVIVFQSRFPILSFMAGAIVGAGAMLSFPNLLPEGLIKFVGALIAGVILGYLSEMLTAKLKKA